MRMFMTDGMFGKCLEQIGEEFDTFDEAMNELAEWKDSKINQRFYKIEPYDRFSFDDKNHETAIDFGDHNVFMLVTDSGKEDVDKMLDDKSFDGPDLYDSEEKKILKAEIVSII